MVKSPKKCPANPRTPRTQQPTIWTLSGFFMARRPLFRTNHFVEKDRYQGKLAPALPHDQYFRAYPHLSSRPPYYYGTINGFLLE